MTITNTTVRERFNGDGAITDFTIPFPFQDTEEILVYKRDENVTPITETLKTLTTDYTLVGGTTDQPTTVRMGSAPLVGEKIVLRRLTPNTQEHDYSQNDGFPAEDHELALDKLTQQMQELYDTLSRAILLPLSSTLSDLTYSEPEAYAMLRWDSLGTSLESVILAATAPLVYDSVTGTFSMPAATAAVNGYMSAAVYSDIYTRLSALLASSGIYTVHGSTGVPTDIVAAAGLAITSSEQRALWFIQGSGGAVDPVATPQISAGAIVGQELRLVGCSNLKTVLWEHGNGLKLNGACLMVAGSVLDLLWDGTDWCEAGRNSI